MERRGLELPLLIGGATTSKQHTAVKIAPEYGSQTVHVLDACRVVDVVSGLLDADRRRALDAENRELQERLREQHAEKVRKPLLPLDGRAREPAPRRRSTTCPRRRSRARARVEPDLASSCRYIDWQFFFHAWELKGRFPAILERPGGARAVRRRAGELLDEIVSDGVAARARRLRLLARARRGRRRRARTARASASSASRPITATAGRTAASPTTSRPPATTSARSPSGSSAPTSSPPRYEAEHDDYRAIMVKALADRLAEAFAEWLHERARREWYAPDEPSASEELVARALPRHPARLRLPGLPRPHREGEAVRAARRARRGLRADGELRDDSRPRRSAASTSRHPRGALLLGRPDRPRPGRGLRRAARAHRSTRPSGGSRRTCPTSSARPAPGRPAARLSCPPGRRPLGAARIRMRTTLKRGVGRGPPAPQRQRPGCASARAPSARHALPPAAAAARRGFGAARRASS